MANILGYLLFSLLFATAAIGAKRYGQQRLAIAILSTLAASLYIFSPQRVLLLGALLAATYAGCQRLRRGPAPLLLAALIAGVVGLWLLTSSSIGASGTSWLVPIAGISFFSFRMIHLAVDCSAGRVRRLDFASYVAYTLFFPTFLSGPIERYQSFERGVEGIGFDVDLASRGAFRMLVGAAKKFVLADLLADFTDHWLRNGQASDHGHLWAALLLYSIRLYADFSGYSDIAIGTGMLIGWRIPENFQRPYLQPNIAAFWQCWHITLSHWLRDYVFIPLSRTAMRARPGMNALTIALGAYLVTMLTCGLWHGRAGHFLLWGFYHGCGLAIHKYYSERGGTLREIVLRLPASVVHAASVAATFTFVTLGWVLFAAPSTRQVLIVLRGLF